MAKKTPRKRRKPNTLDAISGIDAIEILRILADRDKELSKEIEELQNYDSNRRSPRPRDAVSIRRRSRAILGSSSSAI